MASLAEKMVAKYKCPDCGKKWKSINSSGGAKQCLVCLGQYLDPYKMRPIKEKDQTSKRKFGKYNCSCGNSWASGNTWVGKWQKCRDCDAAVFPENIRPLRPGRGFTVQKPHESSLCQRCIELGYNCRNYIAPPNEVVDIPDDQSIISEASTASSSSWAEDQQLSDGDLTPVASDDEEQVEQLLEAKMKAMDINKEV